MKSAGVVENKIGAGGRIALEALKTAPADGSVLAVTPMSPVSIYPHVFKKLAYDPPVDFVAVSTATISHHALAIGPSVPESVKTLKDFLAWAKANPEKAAYGSPGAGSTLHLLGALVLSGQAQLWHVTLFALALGCVTAMDAPVRQTFVAAMVSDAPDLVVETRGLVKDHPSGDGVVHVVTVTLDDLGHRLHRLHFQVLYPPHERHARIRRAQRVPRPWPGPPRPTARSADDGMLSRSRALGRMEPGQRCQPEA